MEAIFFKLNSRLGLYNPPHGYPDRNVGVEDAPDVILSEEYLKYYAKHSVYKFKFSLPEDIVETKADYLDRVYQETLAARDEVIRVLRLQMSQGPNNDEFAKTDTPTDQARVIFLGGDHSVGLVSTSAILELYNPADVLMLMLDSHTDLHQPETSPSGNFHGMWVRPILDKFSYKQIDALVPKKLPAENIIFIGNLDIELAERNFLNKNKIRVIKHEEFNSSQNLPQIIEELRLKLKSKKHLHITIDADGIDRKYAPGTGMPCEEGLLLEPVKQLLDSLVDFPSISMEVVEVNPKKDPDGRTVQLAQDLIWKPLS